MRSFVSRCPVLGVAPSVRPTCFAAGSPRPLPVRPGRLNPGRKPSKPSELSKWRMSMIAQVPSRRDLEPRILLLERCEGPLKAP